MDRVQWHMLLCTIMCFVSHAQAAIRTKDRMLQVEISTFLQDVKALQDLQQVFNLSEKGDPCGTTWSWVECSFSDSIRVTKVDLSTRLAFRNGSIPRSIGNLTALVTLNMNGCSLNGDIPSEISNLTKLIELDLGRNRLTGPIPDLNPTELLSLKLNDNFLTGPISTVSRFTNLSTLYLLGNRLCGNLQDLANLTMLVDLRLSGNTCGGKGGLEGQITNLPSFLHLNYFYIDRNSLTGPIPDFSPLKALKGVKLDDNKFEGPLPLLVELSELTELSVSFNKIGGPIPDLSGLTGLEILNLEENLLNGSIADLSFSRRLQSVSFRNNHLRGPIPDITLTLPSLKKLDLAVNRLTGAIPESLVKKLPSEELILRLEENDFDSIPSALLDREQSNTIDVKYDTDLLQHIAPPGAPEISGGGPAQNAEPTAQAAPVENKSKSNAAIIIALVVTGCLAGLIVLISCFIVRKRMRNKNQEVFKTVARDPGSQNADNMTELDRLHYGPRKFAYEELISATKNFGSSELLGTGGFGSVYRGILQTGGTTVAIKKISNTSKQGASEFIAEVKIIGRMRHRNLVQLLGWCYERGEFMLVYDYMANGSLDQHLFTRAVAGPVLSWKLRFSILYGVASALVYLHDEWEERVVHRDVKASNVLLDSNFKARVGDFGLARLYGHSDVNPASTLGAGTPGYVAPECCPYGKVTDRADVYSFGVLALETVCGRKPLKLDASEGQTFLPNWISDLSRTDQLLLAVDPKLETSGEKYDELQVKNMLQVGLLCTNPDPALRPSMSQVRRMITGEIPVP